MLEAKTTSTICPIAAKIGCSGEILLHRVRQAEQDGDGRDGKATGMKSLERQNRALRRANAILRKRSGRFAQAEFDRRVMR